MTNKNTEKKSGQVSADSKHDTNQNEKTPDNPTHAVMAIVGFRNNTFKARKAQLEAMGINISDKGLYDALTEGFDQKLPFEQIQHNLGLESG